jgi:hypothetical protein
MKKSLVLLAAVSLVFGLAPSTSVHALDGSTSDEQWPHPNIPDPGYQAALFEDQSLTPQARNSWLFAHSRNSVDNCSLYAKTLDLLDSMQFSGPVNLKLNLIASKR